MKTTFIKKLGWKKIIPAIIFIAIVGWLLIPPTLFNNPYSYVLLDKNNRLLQARIADDGQWRFPAQQSVPEKFAKAIVAFEDKRFYKHPGVDFLALGRATYYNIKRKKVVSGGSTISMQVIRLSRNKSRNIWQKLYELALAIRLECHYSKKEILGLYASHAPFGGNVVGLDAASWRYFGRNAAELSWAEAATLAVLPNNPSMVRPDKNRKGLLQKRNQLLFALLQKKIIDNETYKLSLLESIPNKPLRLPEYAPHLLNSIASGKLSSPQPLSLIESTIDFNIQSKTAAILRQHHHQFEANGIHNAAALIIEVESGNVLAYQGNVPRPEKTDYHSYVDIITASRSPGSTLKPILFSAMLQDGLLLPQTLVADIPTQVSGYAPENFDLNYDGAVPASKALARSLNVPAVRMLQQYRVERFYEVLKKLGVTTLTKPSGHYGLSLILGGGENSMWELGGVYASLARLLNHYPTYNGRYNLDDLHMPLVFKTQPIKKDPSAWLNYPNHFLLNAGAIYSTFEAMKEVMRPGEEQLWTQFYSAQRIAWKTGTSFGFRDGWAIGVTPKYAVVVWVGNADGEGRPGLTGINYAAPILFELFRTLPPSQWFSTPFDDMQYINVCHKSGYRASPICEQADSMLVPLTGLRTSPCSFHQLINLDQSGKYRVSDACESPSSMQHISWFILPPAMEWYYKTHHADYKPLPAWRKDCKEQLTGGVMEMIYPRKSNTIYVPIELSGEKGKCVFEAAHRQQGVKIFWHLDESYIGTTTDFHQMELNPDKGKHKLVLVDENGERLEQFFEITDK